MDATSPERLMYMSPERKPGLEAQQASLLEKLNARGIQDYQPLDTKFYCDEAISDLGENFSKTNDVDASLRVAKAFVQESLGIIRNETLALEAIIEAALITRPDLFGNLAEDLQKYIVDVTDVIKNPNPNIRGLFFSREQRVAFTERFRNGAPLMFHMFSGIGDVILTIPAIRKLALAAPNNRIYFVVRSEIAPLAASVLQDYPNISVIDRNDYKDNMPGLGELLAPVPEIGRPAGLLLACQPSQQMEEMFKESGEENILYTRVYTDPPSLPITEGSAIHMPSSYAREVQLSSLLGLDLAEDFPIEGARQVRKRFGEFIDDYINTTPGIAQGLEAIKKKFPKGYVCIVNRGSSNDKYIPPGLTKKIAEFAKRKGMGVVFLHTAGRLGKEKELGPLDSVGVSHEYIEIPPEMDFRYLLTFLREASYIFGPDTGPIHAAELLTEIVPIVNIAINSDISLFRIGEGNLKMLEHPIAEAIRVLGGGHTSLSNLAFAMYPYYPLDPSTPLDMLHPLMQALQVEYKRRVESLLNEL